MPTQALQSPSVTGVDCHAHVMRRDAPLAKESHSAPLHDAPPNEFVALLDSQGLSHGVLAAPSFYGADNTLLLQALAQCPARLRGTAIVEPDIADADLEKLPAAGVVGRPRHGLPPGAVAPEAGHPAPAPPAPGRTPGPRTSEISGLGARLAPITDDLRDKFKLSQDQKGVVVTDVAPDGNAAGRGLKPGDVIVEVQQEPVSNPSDVQERMDRYRKQNRKTVLMLIQSGDGLRWVPVPLASDDSKQPG